MSIMSGQDSRLQIGLADTWRVPTRTRQRLPYTMESFKGTPNYKESDALVGASATTSMAIMSYKADGGFTTYVTPELMKVLIFAALGYEAAPVGPVNDQYAHKFTPVPSGICSNLPSMTVEVDRLLEKALYLNYKMTDWKLSGKAEDYITFECSGPAFKEVLQNVLAKFVASGYNAGAPITVTAPAGVVVVDDEFNGRVARAQLECGEFLYFTVTDCVASTGVFTLTPIWGTAAQNIDGWTVEVVDWEMAPNVPLSNQEYFRFAHAYLYMDDAEAPFTVLGTGGGVDGDTAVDVPVGLTGDASHPIQVAAVDPSGVSRVYKYTGAAITRTGTILSFADAPGTTADHIQAIFNAAGKLHASWTVSEDTYDEVTDFTVGGDNAISDGRFGMNGSLFQSEVNPTKRSFSLDLTSRFTTRLSQLRKKRMMAGVPASLRIEMITKLADGPLGEQITSHDSNEHPYRVVIDIKKAYYVDGIPNISGPDEPTVSPKFTAAETPGVHKAIEVTVYDDKSTKVSGSGGDWAPAVREDGYIG